MPLKLHISNSLDNLAEKLSERINENSENVFQKEIIITQTSGMNRWLSVALAEKSGIFANFDFIKPSVFIDTIFKSTGGIISGYYNTGVFKWILYSLLSDDEFKSLYPDVSDYYLDDDIKRIQLATKLADLFDQYIIYRPELIEAWNNNEEVGYKKLSYHEKWQRYLWVNAKSFIDDDVVDKTIYQSHIINSLKNPEVQNMLRNEYDRVYFFGLSIITKFHVEIIYQLAKYINIDFFFLNPSPGSYWYDTKSEKTLALLEDITGKESEKMFFEKGNPILTSFGRVSRETFYLLFNNESLFDNLDDSYSTVPETNTLLGKIQYDVFNNLEGKNRKKITIENLKDETVIINSSFTIAREVEVLYNYLVHRKEKEEASLNPRDIIVMVSDVDKYTPFIKAIFDTAPYRFPYSIADRSYNGDDTIIGAIDSIIDINENNFTSERVIQLLDIDFIRNKFDISNLSLIRRVVNEANIRFGINGRDIDDTKYVSWNYGLERIILGYAMKGADEYFVGDDSTWPLDIIEGEDAREMLRLKAYVDSLSDAIKERTRDRTLKEWKVYIEKWIINKLIFFEEDNRDEYRYLISRLAFLEDAGSIIDEKISFEVFKISFSASMFSESRSGGYITGAITFCSMIPMRSIPFKIVAMLGMNKDTFPRKETKDAFNLIEEKRKLGDRNVKESDKYLFLENILSANNYLYLSYLGRDPKDNSKLPPSILLDEVLDYIENGSENISPEKVKSIIYTEHPFHGFSNVYYDNNDKYYTYFSDNQDGLAIKENDEKEEIPYDFQNVDIADFIRFFVNPYQYYYNKILKIRYDEDSELLPETEIFSLDKLNEWIVKFELLNSDENQINNYRNKGVKTGGLPLKSFADITLKSLSNEIQPLKKSLEKEIKGMSESKIALSVNLNDTKLSGSISNIYGNRHIIPCISTNESKHTLRAILKQLLLLAAGTDIQTCFISKDGSKTIYNNSTITKNNATVILNELFKYYKRSHNRIVHFYPDHGDLYCKKKNMKSVMDKISKDSGNNYQGVYYDEYLRKAWLEGILQPENFKEEEFIDISELIFNSFSE